MCLNWNRIKCVGQLFLKENGCILQDHFELWSWWSHNSEDLTDVQQTWEQCGTWSFFQWLLRRTSDVVMNVAGVYVYKLSHLLKILQNLKWQNSSPADAEKEKEMLFLWKVLVGKEERRQIMRTFDFFQVWTEPFKESATGDLLKSVVVWHPLLATQIVPGAHWQPELGSTGLLATGWFQ